MSAHAAGPTVYVVAKPYTADIIRITNERDPGDYTGQHRPSASRDAHECEPWMLMGAATIGSYCAACGRLWPWIPFRGGLVWRDLHMTPERQQAQ